MTLQRYKLNLRNPLLLEEYFRVMEQFDSTLSSVIDSTLGLRCRLFGCFFIFFNPIFPMLSAKIHTFALSLQKTTKCN